MLMGLIDFVILYIDTDTWYKNLYERDVLPLRQQPLKTFLHSMCLVRLFLQQNFMAWVSSNTTLRTWYNPCYEVVNCNIRYNFYTKFPYEQVFQWRHVWLKSQQNNHYCWDMIIGLMWTWFSCDRYVTHYFHACFSIASQAENFTIYWAKMVNSCTHTYSIHTFFPQLLPSEFEWAYVSIGQTFDKILLNTSCWCHNAVNLQ